MATIQRTFDEVSDLPDWGDLGPMEKQNVLETTLQDNTLNELIEARQRLEKVYQHHSTAEEQDELLCPTIESVRSLIQMRIQRGTVTDVSGVESRA